MHSTYSHCSNEQNYEQWHHRDICVGSWISLPIEFPCFRGGEDPNEASSSLVLLLCPPQHFDL